MENHPNNITSEGSFHEHGCGGDMSALGQKQTCAVQEGMSAFHPIATAKADIGKIGSRISRCAVVDQTANKSCKTDCKSSAKISLSIGAGEGNRTLVCSL